MNVQNTCLKWPICLGLRALREENPLSLYVCQPASPREFLRATPLQNDWLWGRDFCSAIYERCETMISGQPCNLLHDSSGTREETEWKVVGTEHASLCTFCLCGVHGKAEVVKREWGG